MSPSYPPDPPNPRSNLPLDEIIAIIVALATIGTILFWVLNQPNRKLAITPNLTPPQIQTTSTNPTIAKILEDSLPDGVSPLSEPTTEPTTTPILPAPTVNQPKSTILRSSPPITPQESIKPSPKPQFIPIPSQSQNPTPTKTACSVQPTTGSICLTTPPAEIAKSSTIPPTYWAESFVVYFINKNSAIGSDQKPFQPDQKITREEFATQLQKAFNQKTEKDLIQFKDIPENFGAKSALEQTNQSGFLRGYPGDIFQPKQEISKVQVLVALTSGLGLKPSTNSQETLKIFQDADQIPQWAIDHVAAATEAGLVVNYPDKNTLNPNQTATYSEVASMIYQGLVYQKKAPPISSEYLVKPR